MAPGREIVLKNTSCAEIELREWFDFAAPGRYASKIRLPPFGRCDIPATRFYNRSQAVGRPGIIFVYVNGREASVRLIPQDLLRYVKLTLYLEEGGELKITGVEPKPGDFARFWGLGFLGPQLPRKKRTSYQMTPNIC